MKNRDIYQKDPLTRKLVNEGVASVNDDQTRHAMMVLRYELETFVCDGQYDKGLVHILETYLKNIDQAQQPAVWVSGFYGSGKSHLVKMLRALWVDTRFDDGATARGVASLPQSIMDHLKELSIQGKRHGGLHAASGTLGAGASGSVRLALLRIVFKSAGLPEQYPVARFVMWLRREGIEAQLRTHVEQQGGDWDEELDNFYVAEGLHAALVAVRPNLFRSIDVCVETLNNLYPHVQDVSSDDMLKAVRQALTREGRFPLTLIVLDEVQQYIGEDSQRSIEVQEVVEACSKNIGGKLLFIGTGQTAVTGTSNLKKLQGRFTIRVELSDADVDAVIRRVVLAKNAAAQQPLDKVIQAGMGEITRHLPATSIRHRQEDAPFFIQDYPVLPVRRRFWDSTLRVLDQTGTDSQLRNQLSMIHKVIQTNLDRPLGHVVPADYLYFDAADKLLQARILPRRVHERTLHWLRGDAQQQLTARACGLIFLINRLAGNNHDIGIRATVDVLADLMLEELAAGSGDLRRQLPPLLDACDLLMKIGDEYRIQTEESSAWNDEFLSQRASLANDIHRVDAERDDRLRRKCGEIVRRVTPLLHGMARVPREIQMVFDDQLPADADQRLYLWVRDGWGSDSNSVRADTRQLGNAAPTVVLFIPKRSADALRRYLLDSKAAHATLEKRGSPNTPEGIEARAAMETTRQNADSRIRELIDEAVSGARVLQAGGHEIAGNDLATMLTEAATHSLQRLYPQFHLADHAGWSRVYDRAQQGAPDALKAVGDEGEPARNAVCKAILGFIAGGRKGAEIRTWFESAPYGWSRDAVDGGLHVLLVAGLLRAQDEQGRAVDHREMERKAMSRVLFRVESATVTVAQRIQVRKLFQQAGLPVRQGEESAVVGTFLQKLRELAEQAGGEPPAPARPDTAFLEEIRLTAGNEQLLALYNQREDLSRSMEQWTTTAARIGKRRPDWLILKRLAAYVRELPDMEPLLSQVNTLEQQRQLLVDPDPVAPLVASLTQRLRDALNRLDHDYADRHRQGMERLASDGNWQQLEPAQRHELLSEQLLHEAARPAIAVQGTAEVLATLEKYTLARLEDRVAALSARFEKVARGAAELCEPQTQFVPVPRRTLKTGTDIDAWLAEVEQKLRDALSSGPVMVK